MIIVKPNPHSVTAIHFGIAPYRAIAHIGAAVVCEEHGEYIEFKIFEIKHNKYEWWQHNVETQIQLESLGIIPGDYSIPTRR